MKIKPPKKIETERLILRPFKLGDAKDFIEVRKSFNYRKSYNLKTAKEWIKKSVNDKEFYLAIVLKENNKVIGDLEICHFDWFDYMAGEIGYGLHKKYWRKGYTSEAIRAFIDYCFKKYRFVKIYADTDDDNKASQGFLKSLGFKLEGVIRKRRIVKGKWKDEWDYGLLKEEWKR